MSRSHTFRAAHGLWVLPVLALVALGVMVSGGVALMMAPGLLLLAVLLAGRAPGEQLIERLRRRTAAPRRRRSPVRVAAPRLDLVVRPAGRALSVALAMRPPPASSPLFLFL